MILIIIYAQLILFLLLGGVLLGIRRERLERDRQISQLVKLANYNRFRR